MFHRKSFRFVSLISVLILFMGVLPAHAAAFASPLSASSGNFLWAKGMGGTSDDLGNAIAVDGSGNVYTTGGFNGTADFDPCPGTYNLTSAGQYDIFISKLDSSGNFLWAKGMGGTNYDIGNAIAVDGSGNVYTTGYFSGTADFDPSPGTTNLISAGPQDIFVSKLDSSGNFVWAKDLGGTSGDVGYAIAVDGSGNVYTTGDFSSTADFDPGAGTANLTSAGGQDIFVSKLDSSGNFVWAKGMGGTSSDYGNAIALDGSGNVYTTGWFQGTADFDPGAGTFNLTSGSTFVSKLDSGDNFVWAKGLSGSLFVDRNAIAVDGSGNVYTTGHFQGTGDFDPGPGTYNLASAGQYDIFISKLDSSGNFLWAKGMGGTNDDIGNAIAVDGSGNVYTTGYFNGTADFDPGAGTANLTSAGNNDIFISKLDSSGNFLWAKGMGGIDDDHGSAIVVDGSGNVYTTGYFNGTADFDPDAGTANLTSAGNIDIFVSKLENDVTAPTVSSIQRANPNPTNLASVDFTVTFSELVTGVEVGDFALTTTGVTGASISGVSGSGTTYTVTVDTGAGSGTIRLDVVDDDSVKDESNNPLGGLGAGNGNYSGGETYTIDKTSPAIASITRANANPTNAANVSFTATFSESVTGVDVSDFALTTTGVTGTSITGVSGSGSSYTITVNTGARKGTLRLDVVDDDSVQDALNNPLGGVGVGNGNYTSGETYSVYRVDTTGVFRPSNGLLYLKNANTTGFADVAINYGTGGDYPVVGDWDGDGTATIGIYRNGSFYLRNSNTLGFADFVFAFGQPGDQPVAGDWNSDGVDTIGIYRPSTGQFLLRDNNSAGAADYSFYLGNVGDVGIAGDWTAKGFDTVGVFRPSNGIIFLKNTNQTGFADIALNYGLAGDQPVVGDWDGNGTDTIGVYRNAQFLLRNSNTIGFADLVFGLGNPGDMPIAGDWDGLP